MKKGCVCGVGGLGGQGTAWALTSQKMGENWMVDYKGQPSKAREKSDGFTCLLQYFIQSGGRCLFNHQFISAPWISLHSAE